MSVPQQWSLRTANGYRAIRGERQAPAPFLGPLAAKGFESSLATGCRPLLSLLCDGLGQSPQGQLLSRSNHRCPLAELLLIDLPASKALFKNSASFVARRSCHPAWYPHIIFTSSVVERASLPCCHGSIGIELILSTHPGSLRMSPIRVASLLVCAQSRTAQLFGSGGPLLSSPS